VAIAEKVILSNLSWKHQGLRRSKHFPASLLEQADSLVDVITVNGKMLQAIIAGRTG